MNYTQQFYNIKNSLTRSGVQCGSLQCKWFMWIAETKGRSDQFDQVLNNYYQVINSSSKPIKRNIKGRNQKHTIKFGESKEHQAQKEHGAAFLAVCRGKVKDLTLSGIWYDAGDHLSCVVGLVNTWHGEQLIMKNAWLMTWPEARFWTILQHGSNLKGL